MEIYANQLIATLLISLRIVPTLAFAPPFTLLRIPASARVILSLAIALWIVLANPAETSDRLAAGASLPVAAATELLLGIAMTLGLHLAFAAILTIGRAIDIQAGFGLAQLVDPTLRTQMALVGTLFSYAAAAIFFTTSGPSDLLAVWAYSVQVTPLGGFTLSDDLSGLLNYISVVFLLAVGLAAIVLVTLFVVDIAIALLSRTLPQMNVLILGFQVKILALLLTLPFVFAFMGAGFLRLMTMAISSTFGLV